MHIMERLVAIKIAAQALGVSVVTERRWEAEGGLIPERTCGGQRRYDLARQKLDRYAVRSADRRTIAYARVSSHDQSSDLERQKQVLELYCAQQGWSLDRVSDLGSGMNDDKKGLKRQKLLDGIAKAVDAAEAA
jgi:putative resolvase